MPNEILPIVNAISGLGFTGLMIVLAVPKLKKMVFGNGNGEIRKVTENHLPHLEEKMDEIIKILNEQAIKNAERHGEIMAKIN